jgi:hypothetical protein
MPAVSVATARQAANQCGVNPLPSTTRSDGFNLVPENSEGFPAGAIVEVHLY